MHVIFSPHHAIAPHAITQSQHQNLAMKARGHSRFARIDRGYRYIRMIWLLGRWEVPPRKIPPSPRISQGNMEHKVTGQIAIIAGMS